MRTFLFLLIAAMFPIFMQGCAKKTMNERDVRREQLRLNAYKKRQEIKPLAGNYRGFIKEAGGFSQEVSLHLELKDIPETEGGQVDPVLLPTVSGALNLTYGTGEELEQISFGTTKADYNSADNRLDVIVSNSLYSDINLSMTRSGDTLIGSWSSPSTSLSGAVELSRTDVLNLGGESDPFGGAYEGLLLWSDKDWYTGGKLTLTTAKDGIGNFHVTGSLKVILQGSPSGESFVYEYDTVEFNPLSRQVSIRSDSNDIYFTGQHDGSAISGQWFSRRIGLIGTAVFNRKVNEIPSEKINAPSASGSWFGNITNSGSSSQLPEKMLLSFNIVPAKDQPGGLSLVGSSRFYYGPFSSNEYLEYRFESIDYQPFAGKLVAVTAGSPKLTFSIDLAEGELTGTITDSSLGRLATFRSGRDPGPDSGISLAGTYKGIFLHEIFQDYQNAKIDITPTLADDGLNLSAVLTLFLGPLQSSETLTYSFGEPQFNSVTGALTLTIPGYDVTVKGFLRNGEISGEWHTTSAGRMGPISLKKGTEVQAPANYTLMSTVRGTYQGSLKNTSQSTNLPERIMFGLITTLDPAAPRGLRVTGNLRLYYGSFDSNEFVELPLDSIQFDPYKHTFTGKTSGSLRLTVYGNMTSDHKTTGTLSDDALGQVGEFEVTKNVQ